MRYFYKRDHRYGVPFLWFHKLQNHTNVYHFRGMENVQNIVADRKRTYEEIEISNVVLRGRKNVFSIGLDRF